MKPQLIGMVGLLALILVLPVSTAQDLNIGKVNVPRAFVHGDQTYAAGVYRLSLTEKDGIPWFRIFDGKNSQLFEEMGVVTLKKSRTGKRGFRVYREMLRGYEFFRIRVVQPERWVTAYFLIKQK